MAEEGISRPKNTQDIGILPFLYKAKKGRLKDKNEMCAIRLTTQEQDFLMDVWQNATSSVKERYRRLNFSSFFGNKLQNSFINSGLIYFSFIILQRGRIKILTLTEKGKKVLGINPGKSDRHGSPEHRYWVRAIAEHIKNQGYDIGEEVPIGGGKTIDIVANRHGKQIAFEIETGKSDTLANVQKCLDIGIDEVFVVATSKRVKDNLAAMIKSHPGIKLVTGNEMIRLLNT